MPDDFLTSGISIGHSVPFFGRNEAVFWVSSNGFITLVGPTSDGCCEGQPFPSRGSPNEGVLAGFWTDLDPSAGGTVKFQNLPAPPASNASRVLVVEYANVPLKANASLRQTFQIHAYDNGFLEVHWIHVDSGGVAQTSVGVENARGSVGAQFEIGPSLNHTNEAIRFTPTIQDLPAPAPSVTFLSPGSGSPGTRVTIGGDDFQPGVNVTFDGVQATTTFLFAQQIEAIVPNLPTGTVTGVVTNPDGGNATFTFSITEPLPPPVIHALVPNPARVGDLVLVEGANFRQDDAPSPCCPTLTVGGSGVGFTILSSSVLQFTVPDIPSPALVEFLRVDGGSASATLVIDRSASAAPTIANVSPSLVTQGASISVRGSGFEPDSVVLAGDRALATTFVASTRLDAIVDDLVAPGRHDITVLVDGRSVTLPGALVVRGLPDIVIEELVVERPTVGNGDVGVASDLVAPQKVLVTVANRGFENPGASGRINLTWREADDTLDPLGRAASEPTRFASLGFPALSPGESVTIQTTWQRRFSAGEFVIGAEASLNNRAAERSILNNVLETRAFVGVSGVRAVTPCDVQPVLGGCSASPSVMERRNTTSSETFANDAFSGTSFAFDVRTAAPVFNFDQPDRIFDTHTNVDGVDTSCTVWRFFGGRGGLFVEAEDDNWLAGSALVTSFNNVTVEGMAFDRTTSSTFVLGVEVDRVESSEDRNVTDPRGDYSRGPVRDLVMDAFGLRGDFSRCTITEDDNVTERFVFAALPQNVEQPAPNFSGVGFAASSRFFYHAVEVHSTTSDASTLPPLGVLA